MRYSRPVKATDLFASPEMALRCPGEIELKREGSDEGEGRGFDLADPSAGAERNITADQPAGEIVSWFASELIKLGWTDDGEGWFTRDDGESFLARVDRDQGRSRVAAAITDERYAQMQDQFERFVFYAGAPEGWSVVTLSYTVRAASER